jgi:hypothetical protein
MVATEGGAIDPVYFRSTCPPTSRRRSSVPWLPVLQAVRRKYERTLSWGQGQGVQPCCERLGLLILATNAGSNGVSTYLSMLRDYRKRLLAMGII